MTTAAQEPAIMSRVGHYYEAESTYQVGREKIREYARAVQDYHPVHWEPEAAEKLGYSGLITPLTFTSIGAMAANRKLLEEVVVGYETYVQTEQVFEQHRPIVQGDELLVDVELSSVRRIAGRDLITITNTFLDVKSGETVHTMHTTVVGVTADEVDPNITQAVSKVMMHDVDIFSTEEAAERYVKTERTAGERTIAQQGLTRTPGSRNFDELSVGDEIPVHHTHLSRGDLVNYAGVAGDANPIHWDETCAKLAGLPDVIAHGMLTMGLGAGVVADWSGDPGAVTKYSVRLSSPAIVPADGRGDIEFGGRIKSLDPETRSGVVILTAKSAGKKIFGMATLNIRFS
ncbi:beta-hydroxyacyl-[acyl-carrier-protein] dehydratase subunit HadB [Gordonia araii NBRC 100433]|uniref:Beta-hydroxyacyl-[acyl-carrier-protein] dehydratase subunit HadB n=1 Tax=Gordonia araii NBRC 100433 TaxID=1073574 RepID=G7H748_9ACTN|nr:fused (3R)-hydroxyacyl-ACP dehydratase subunits HadA/HadB [Gordonia araii]NNG97669.1 (R)-hydratase [Gordonia araii NBRC 100433]GAB11673.1 beta-hydroxyacyl-[acyl-carrier-protein] dehydratase subunit HadB [Gordonia araii NBRC 100433]